MDVTIFIGNGFDLNVGLKTSHDDFLDYYLNIKSKNPVITEKKHLISTERVRDIHSWSDLEISLGKFSEQFDHNLKGEKEFCDLIDDLISHLSEFVFQAQSDAVINRTTEDSIHQCFKKALRCPYKGLPEENIRIVTKEWQEQTHHDLAIRYHFVSYNYSFVFDRCLQRFIKLGSIHTSTINQKPIDYEFSSVTHVHGTHRSAMILGVDNRKQILNKDFHNETLDSKFIKSTVNQNNRRNREKHARDALEKSQFAFVFGMSLGSSDDSWWLQLGNWLIQDWQRHLIVYYTNFTIRPESPDGDFRAEMAVKNAFKRAMGEKLLQQVTFRIHVALNYAIFPLTLVP